jgi:nitrite reductase (NO-forming)
MRKTGFVAVTALAVVLSIVFVGGFARASTNAQTASGTPCASPVASPEASPMASPSASPMASPAAECAPAAAGGTTIDMGDLYFKPNSFTISANTEVTVTLKNVGALPHDFNIDQLNVHSPVVQPGQTATVTIKGAAGTYQYYCNQPGHKAAGMVGTLTIK